MKLAQRIYSFLLLSILTLSNTAGMGMVPGSATQNPASIHILHEEEFYLQPAQSVLDTINPDEIHFEKFQSMFRILFTTEVSDKDEVVYAEMRQALAQAVGVGLERLEPGMGHFHYQPGFIVNATDWMSKFRESHPDELSEENLPRGISALELHSIVHTATLAVRKIRNSRLKVLELIQKHPDTGILFLLKSGSILSKVAKEPQPTDKLQIGDRIKNRKKVEKIAEQKEKNELAFQKTTEAIQTINLLMYNIQQTIAERLENKNRLKISSHLSVDDDSTQIVLPHGSKYTTEKMLTVLDEIDSEKRLYWLEKYRYLLSPESMDLPEIERFLKLYSSSDRARVLEWLLPYISPVNLDFGEIEQIAKLSRENSGRVLYELTYRKLESFPPVPSSEFEWIEKKIRAIGAVVRSPGFEYFQLISLAIDKLEAGAEPGNHYFPVKSLSGLQEFPNHFLSAVGKIQAKGLVFTLADLFHVYQNAYGTENGAAIGKIEDLIASGELIITQAEADAWLRNIHKTNLLKAETARNHTFFLLGSLNWPAPRNIQAMVKLFDKAEDQCLSILAMTFRNPENIWTNDTIDRYINAEITYSGDRDSCRQRIQEHRATLL